MGQNVFLKIPTMHLKLLNLLSQVLPIIPLTLKIRNIYALYSIQSFRQQVISST